MADTNTETNTGPGAETTPEGEPGRVAPNPASPFADADPTLRHSLAAFSVLLPLGLEAGQLAETGCGYTAVVPDEPLRDLRSTHPLPAGLCPACVAETRDGSDGAGYGRGPAVTCRTCGQDTAYTAAVCSLCRIRMHAAWVDAGRPDGSTLDETVARTVVWDDWVADAVRERSDEQDTAGAGGDMPVDAGLEEAYPAPASVYCDSCGADHRGDYLVTDSMPRSARLEAARAHLRTLGWSCTAEGDYCPTCALPKPPIVVICGSTRFMAEMAEANLRLTAGADGRRPAIVLAPGCNMKVPHPLWADPADAERLKVELDELHRAKIRLADLMVVVGDYAGDSTRREIAYARERGLPVEFTDPRLAAEFGAATVQDGAAR